MDQIRPDVRWWNWLFEPTSRSETVKTGEAAVTECR